MMNENEVNAGVTKFSLMNEILEARQKKMELLIKKKQRPVMLGFKRIKAETFIIPSYRLNDEG